MKTHLFVDYFHPRDLMRWRIMHSEGMQRLLAMVEDGSITTLEELDKEYKYMLYTYVPFMVRPKTYGFRRSM